MKPAKNFQKKIDLSLWGRTVVKPVSRTHWLPKKNKHGSLENDLYDPAFPFYKPSDDFELNTFQVFMNAFGRSKFPGSWTKHTCNSSGLEAYKNMSEEARLQFIEEHSYQPSECPAVTKSSKPQEIELPDKFIQIEKNSDAVVEISDEGTCQSEVVEKSSVPKFHSLAFLQLLIGWDIDSVKCISVCDVEPTMLGILKAVASEMTQFNSLFAALTTIREQEKQRYSSRKCSTIDSSNMRHAIDQVKLEMDGCVAQLKSGIETYSSFLSAGKI
jgi:hypothetical protein